MKHVEIVQADFEKLLGLTCNCCGKRFNLDDGIGANDVNPLEISGAYGSTYPEDLTTVKFDACGECIAKWVSGFKIPPEEVSWIG